MQRAIEPYLIHSYNNTVGRIHFNRQEQPSKKKRKKKQDKSMTNDKITTYPYRFMGTCSVAENPWVSQCGFVPIPVQVWVHGYGLVGL